MTVAAFTFSARIDRHAHLLEPPVGDQSEWYCPRCRALVRRVDVNVKNIVVDLPPLVESFSAESRRCLEGGHIHPGKA